MPLSVVDCMGNGHLAVSVPWSESTASQKALIKFKPELCDNNAPKGVEVFLAHGTAIKLTAKDATDAVVDTIDDSGSDPTDVQVLALSSELGISEIEIEGAEICILMICWECEGPAPGPTPTPTCTPIIPDRFEPLEVYEFDQIDLEADGWVEIPGGFIEAKAGRITPFDFSPDLIPSSRDGRGLAISVKAGEVALIYPKKPINTRGGPVLIRMTVRADRPEASVALAALKGDLTTGEGVDWSIATHIPATAASFVDKERRLILVYQPDEPVGIVTSGPVREPDEPVGVTPISPLIQVACTLEPEQSTVVTVFVDKMEVLALDPEIFGSTPSRR